MNPVELNYTVDLAKRETRVKELDRSLFFGDKNAYKLNVTVERNGLPEDLTDMSCRGYIVYEGTNTTYQLEVAGISGNVAWVLFDENSLLTTGRASIKVQLTKAADNFALTVFALYGDVKLGITDTIFVPTGSILDINALIDKMEEFDEIIAGAASAISGAENIDISMTQSDGVFNITTTNRNGQQTTVAIPDPAAEVKKKANRSSVTADRTISGTGKVEFPDALDEPMSLKLELEPKQYLHGYDKPWVGGSGKNLLPVVRTNKTDDGITFIWNDDGTLTTVFPETRSANVRYDLLDGDSFTIAPGTYKLLGRIDGSSQTSTTRIALRTIKTSSSSEIASAANEPVEFTITENTVVYPVLFMASGAVSATLTWTPRIYVSSEQDQQGSPLPYEPYSNICPITGYDAVEVVSTGKNLFDPTLLIADRNAYVNATNGAVNVTTTTPEYRATDFIPCKSIQNQSIVLNHGARGSTPGIAFYDEEKTFISGVQNNNASAGGERQYTVPANAHYLRFTTLAEYEDVVQLELGSTATAYEPYQGQTLNVEFPTEAGTVYGGTVTVNEDGSGELVVDKYCIDLGSLTWNYEDVTSRFYCDNLVSNLKGKTINGAARSVKCISDRYKCLCNSEPYAQGWNSILYFSSEIRIYVHDSRYTDATLFKSGVTGSYLVYELAIPQIYPLTASQINSLLGYTQVITDTDGALTVGYKTDKYAKLEKFLAALPSDTATGDPAVFTDGADGLPMKKLQVAIEPKQDLHGYDKPWAGGAGKNLFGGKYGTANKYPIPAGITQLTFSGKSQGTYNLYFRYYDENDSSIGSFQFIATGNTSGSATSQSIPENAKSFIIYSPNSGDTTTFSEVQAEAGLTATSYEPYSNICPISGWDEVNATRVGKNLFDGQMELGQISSTNGDNTNATTKIRSIGYIPVKKDVVYTLSRTVVTGYVKFRLYDEDKAFLGTSDSNLFTLIDGSSKSQPMIANVSHCTFKFYDKVAYLRFQDNTMDLTAKYQFEVGSVATAYEPYKSPATLSVNVKSLTDGTVYGGTLTVNADGSGTVVVDRAKVTFTGMQWAANSMYANTYNIVLPNTYPRHSVTDLELSKSLSNMYMWYRSAVVGNEDYGFAMGLNNDLQFYVKDKDVATVEAANAKFTNLEICYPLHYPTTFTLTATQLQTLLGNNTVWSDAGEVTVEYCADVGKYIEKKIQALA